MIGGGGEKKTLRLVAQYADACNFFGTPDVVAHKIDVLRGHCDALGRDIGTIEVTALLQATEGWTADDVLRDGEAYAAVGVATVMASALGATPVNALESVFGPAIERLGPVQPKPL
jgi:alkanesulfonate monooxygenase SsuD/methylene tetrahydromethanopterin reductase-like flavin-dependent oxidoreductase (luciferase family)